MSNGVLETKDVGKLLALHIGCTLLTISKNGNLNYEGLVDILPLDTDIKGNKYMTIASELSRMEELSVRVSKTMDRTDRARVNDSFISGTLSMISGNVNLTLLGLYILFMEFQDLPDPKMDSRFDVCKEFNYIKTISSLCDDIGFTHDIEASNWNLAVKITEAIEKH